MESRESIDLDLGKYLLGVKRQLIPAITVFVVTVALSAAATTRLKPSYESSGKLLFKFPSFNIVGSNLIPNASDAGGDLKSLVSSQNPISTQMEVIKSPSVLQKTIDKLKLKNSNGKPLKPSELKSSLQLKIIGGTDVLEVSYKSRKPEETAAVVNSVMNVYLENDILSNRAEAEATRLFMDKQLPTAQNAVQNAEIALRKFKQENNIVDLSEETITSVKVIGVIDEQINNVKAELAQVTTQTQELKNQLNLTSQQAMVISAISQSRAIQDILSQLQDTERQLAIQRSRFLDDNPAITSLEAKRINLTNILQQQVRAIVGNNIEITPKILQIGDLKQQLIQNLIQSEIQSLGLNEKYQALLQSRSSYQQRLKVIPQLEERQRELERRVEVAQSTYQTLLKKSQELQVAENNNTANARIIVSAQVPEKPAGKKKFIIVAVGVLLGAFLGTTTILLLEMRDRSLKTVQEIREIFDYTLLGIFPSLLKKSFLSLPNSESSIPKIIAKDAPQSVTSEMYRVTQANIRLLSSDTMIKSIVVTSSIAKEGKSTVAANLATVISQLGRKVLLIDADLRVPSQHHFWGITSSPGLSEVLVGQEKCSNAISKVMDNLDVLPAGVRPPNPLTLLDSKRMAALIEKLSSHYDFVIIDTPPLLVGADAVTVSKMTDGILLVARPGVIDHHNALSAKEMLKRSNYNVLGLLVNGIIEKNEPNNYFYSPQEYYSAAPKSITKKSRIKA
ncbi:MAG: polysaccharide biosynthesis tyrosine autokinase [Nostocales cyanobacterium]|nr:MAG: polysaccharide biosynthesis tyrosine autokinase [Nostocales cyanobacterium]TAF08860.1 MAG: polysaccharide biosynthesis tyrosine autokinase [Nostocales cyanobacterium]